MCLIAWSWQPAARQPLLLLANRDEFYARPSEAAHLWGAPAQCWAGRDVLAGGTWLGMDRRGRWAALTNHRDGPRTVQPGLRSRGMLVLDFLQGEQSPADYLAAVLAEGQAYDGFNLLVGEVLGHAGRAPSLWYGGNRPGAQARALPAGVYGLSNAVLDTGWPKLRTLRDRVSALASPAEGAWHDAAWAALDDGQPFEDASLPDTGVGLPLERMLSAAFIVSPDYGTRAQTVWQVCDDMFNGWERRYETAAQGMLRQPQGEASVLFPLHASLS